MIRRFQRMPRIRPAPAETPAETPIGGPARAPVPGPGRAARRVRLGWSVGAPREALLYGGAVLLALAVLLGVRVALAGHAPILTVASPAVTPAAGPGATPGATPATSPGPAGATALPAPADAPADAAAPPAESVAAAPPVPAVSEAARARAVDLLGAAAAERQAGRLGAALDLTRQSLAQWPDFADAATFAGEIAPQATATAQAVQAAQAAQATAVAAQAQQRATAVTPQAQPRPAAEGVAPAPPAAPGGAPAPAGQGPMAYGFQGEFFHAPTRPQALAAIKSAGFGWAKQQALWEDYEIQAPECERDRGNCVEQAINGRPKYFRKNRLEWLDAIVDDASAGGIKVLLSVVRAPEFYAAPGGHSPTDPQTLGDFLQFLATRYKGKVQAIEPWNEQNLSWEWGGARLWPNAPVAPPQGVVEFVRLQQAAYRGIKAADPSIVVVLPALTPTGLGECWLDPGARVGGGCVEQVQKAIDDRLYLEFLFQVNNGEIKGFYDVLGVHPSGYNNPPDDFLDQKTVPTTTFKGHGSFYIRRYQQLRDVQLKYGDNKPMWFTEVGWSSTQRSIPGYEYGSDNSEAARGRYVARLLEQLTADAPYVTGVFFWNLNFRTVVPEADEKYGFGLLNPDLSPTPGYSCAADFVKSGRRITRGECRPAP